MKSLFPAVSCVACLLIQFHSFAAENQLRTVVSNDLILVDNPLSAEQVALSEVEIAVRQNPGQAPDVVTKAIRTEVPHPVPFSCEIVRAAIAGFGKQITRIGVARAVYSAVKASPEETLGIVAVAIEDTAPGLHQDVVGAAIAAVPDPYACISGSLPSPPCPEPKKAPHRWSARFPDREVEPNALVPTLIEPEPCNGTPLAEAIVQEALLSGATENEFTLYPDPGIGDLAYDYLINKFPVLKPTPPPTPPPVSP
jgi:hypothetical protein